jgi:hypothetical protein
MFSNVGVATAKLVFSGLRLRLTFLIEILRLDSALLCLTRFSVYVNDNAPYLTFGQNCTIILHANDKSVVSASSY